MANVSRQHGVTLIQVDPESDALDEWTIGQFRNLLLHAVDQAEPPLVVVDLSQTSFIGSSVVGVLLRAWKRVRDRRGRMALCGLNPVCAEALHVSKLYTIWDIYSTREEAREALATG